jgi:hypothetical protein
VNLMIAATALAGAAAIGAELLLPVAMLALAHALCAIGALRAGRVADPRVAPALSMAAGGMALLILCASLAGALLDRLEVSGAGQAAWGALPLPLAPMAPMSSPPGLLLVGASGAAVAALVCLLCWSLARGRTEPSPVREVLAQQWLVLGGALGAVAVGSAVAGHQLGADAPAVAEIVLQGARLMLWLLLAWVGLRSLARWPGYGFDRPAPHGLRTDAERAIEDVLAEVPLAGRRVGVHLRDGRPHVHLVGLVDDATDLDAEGQDVLRARLYERLRLSHPDLALDVQFTRDAFWAERSLCGG